ncbi:GIY-YIG nuclease family protein [Sphingobium fuliginis]|uniref:GIY-YIG nuclease family protein n=1 Tax=Sphingobium fuliginis (strain ATCC 27551) TaxID=336203 RepID=UPI0036136627
MRSPDRGRALNCDRHTNCAGYVYVIWHPQARDRGFYTKVGFSRSHPAPEVSHRKLGSYVKRDSRHYPFIFTCDALGLDRPQIEVGDFLERGKCIESSLHKLLADKKRLDCGVSKEVFDVSPDAALSLRAQLIKEWSDS